LTNDTPFQIHDIDGDGRSEVVLVRDFRLQILDGATGKVKRQVPMPKAPASKEPGFDRVSGDSIAFLNLSGDPLGKPVRHELLVKDRYEHFWVYNNKLELLWQGQEQTGHYPYPFPATKDGRDEVAIGYSIWTPQGKRLWSQGSVLKDHADGVMVGNLSGDPKAGPRMYASGSDEGFLMFDLDGKLLKQVRVGHNQSPAVGKFRSDLPGLEYISVNFWKNPGIVTLFDWDGKILAQEEPIHTGSPMLPVNWRGDGQERDGDEAGAGAGAAERAGRRQRSDAGDQHRRDQRNHRHPNQVDEYRADRRQDGEHCRRGGRGSGRQGQAENEPHDQADQHARRQRHA
jgi:hypothetical protein